jgi:hypothetical protein
MTGNGLSSSWACTPIAFRTHSQGRRPLKNAGHDFKTPVEDSVGPMADNSVQVFDAVRRVL